MIGSNPNSVLPHLQSSQQQMQKLGHIKLVVGQQQQQQQQLQLQQNVNAKPVYTLPGVISYLTSEFTNLERFKIMTNLEKSEMKHRILELQGEVNALTYVNRRQHSRIQELEKENGKLRAAAISGDLKNEETTGADTEVDQATEIDSVPVSKSATAEEEGTQFALNIDGLPEVDLQAIKKLRNALAKSMKEILDLLKAPTARNAVPDALGNPDSFLDNYDVLAAPREILPNSQVVSREPFNAVPSESAIDSFVFSSAEPRAAASGADGDLLSMAPKYESDSETVVMGGFNDSTEALSEKLDASNSSTSSGYKLDIPVKFDDTETSPPSPARINEMAFIDYSNDNKYSTTRKFFHRAYVLILAYNESKAKVSIWSPSKLSSFEFEIENPADIVEAYCLNPEEPNAKLILIYSSYGRCLAFANGALENDTKFSLDFVGTKFDLLIISNSEAYFEFLLLLSSASDIKAYRVLQPEPHSEFTVKTNIADLSCDDLGLGLIQKAHWLREEEEDLSRKERHELASCQNVEDSVYKIIITGDSFIAKLDMFTYEVQTLNFDLVKTSAFVNEHQVVVTEDETILVDLSQFRVTAKLEKTGPVFGVTVLESNGHVFLVRLSDEGVLTIFDENLEDPQQIPVRRDSKSIGSIKGLIVLDSPDKSTLYVYDLPTLRFMYS